MEELVKVPWFVTQNGEREEIRAEPPVETESYDDSAVEQQLRDLGYTM